ncbi:MAG: VWA domain-containing protein [Ignavibacteriales bacterium]|nr:VWA domain-containing protein [Ignavibacteriales bacterium]
MKPIYFKKILQFLCIFLAITSISFADGFIVIDPYRPIPIPSAFPLEVVYHRVTVTINGQIAETHIEQSFYNPTNYMIEGYYIFPIPKNAVFKSFSMFINGKETPAELLDAKKAKEIYEEIVRKLKDPALLEYSEQNIYKVRIFPIESRAEKKVTITYREVINKESGIFEYVYPLNTEKFSAKPLKDVSVHVKLESDEEIKNIYSPTHNIDIVRKSNNQVEISYEETNVKPNIDFKLYYNTNNSKLGLSLISYKKSGEDGMFFLSVTPSIYVNKNDISEKDITFVLDISGSMAGDKLDQAKKALIYCIENLNMGDRFEIIKFSTEAYAFFKKLVDANSENKKKARDFINELNPVGGTNIDEALQLALSTSNPNNRPHMIIFITDGKPTIGETNEDKLVQKVKDENNNKYRIFTFGIGNEINTHLLDKITEVTKASRTYIAPNEDIELKISQFYDKVQSPVLTDVSIDYGSIEVFQTYPKTIPDLFKGSNLIIFGRYKSSGNSQIVLKGKIKGMDTKYSFNVDFVNDNTKNDFIPPLWASRRIGYLLDQIRLNGESKEVVDEITELARTYGIVTPYTSYLILEDEKTRVAGRYMNEEFQTLGDVMKDEEFYQRNKGEYQYLSEKTGQYSVQASEEVNGLNDAYNVTQTNQGANRMNYFRNDGTEQNLTQQVRNVLGRAVYQSENYWIDSELQTRTNQKNVRIKFASDEYFELLNKNNESAQFLALGQNVRFSLDNTYYEIYE